MWGLSGYVRFLRGTTWYQECRRYSEACNLPFEVGAGISVAIVSLLLMLVAARALA